MIVCVLGMHKSGTTLVAESLHHSGVHMADVDPTIGYDDSNKWERHTAILINRDMLVPAMIPTVQGYRVRNAGLDRSGYPSNRDSLAIVRTSKLERVLASFDREPIRELAEHLDREHGSWGFKDPRTCLTYTVWRDALPNHRLIAVYRPLGEVLARYRATSWRSPSTVVRVVRNWLLHNERLLTHVSTTSDRVVVRYDRLMREEAELDRIRRYLDIDLIDRRDPALYRARSNRVDELPVALPTAVRRRARRLEDALDEQCSR